MNLVSNWRGRGFLAAILAMGALGLGMILTSAQSTSAQTAPSVAIKQFTLSGNEEVPVVSENTTGYFSATLSDGKLEFDLSADGTDITMAHIHLGAKGSNGPVVAFLFGPVDPGVGALHPTGTITQANLVGPLAGNFKGFTDALASGQLYVNAHSKLHPGGVVRGQIPATSLAPAAPKPPATGSGTLSDSAGPIGVTQGAGAALLAIAVVTLVVVATKRKA